MSDTAETTEQIDVVEPAAPSRPITIATILRRLPRAEDIYRMRAYERYDALIKTIPADVSSVEREQYEHFAWAAAHLSRRERSRLSLPWERRQRQPQKVPRGRRAARAIPAK